MAGLFAVDGHVQVDDAGVLPLGEAGHLHCRAVGDLLIQTQQHFLPNDLGADLLIRLVGGHAVGEQLRSFHGVPLHLGQQLLQTVAGAGGDGDDGVEIRVDLAVCGDDRQQIVLALHGADLIDAQYAGQLLLPDALEKDLLRLSHVGDGLHQQQGGLHTGQTLPYDLHHIVPQPGAGLVQARRIQQDELGVAPVHYTVDAVSGGLGLVGDDGDLLTHQGVGETGLAHVGPSAHGDHSGFGDGVFLIHKVILSFL